MPALGEVKISTGKVEIGQDVLTASPRADDAQDFVQPVQPLEEPRVIGLTTPVT